MALPAIAARALAPVLGRLVAKGATKNVSKGVARSAIKGSGKSTRRLAGSMNSKPLNPPKTSLLNQANKAISGIKNKASNVFGKIESGIKPPKNTTGILGATAPIGASATKSTGGKWESAKKTGKTLAMGAIGGAALSSGFNAGKSELNSENPYKIASSQESEADRNLRDAAILLGAASIVNMIATKNVGAPIENVVRGAGKIGQVIRNSVSRQFRMGKDVNSIYDVVKSDFKIGNPKLVRSIKNKFGDPANKKQQGKLDKMISGAGAGIGIGLGNLLVQSIAEKRVDGESARKLLSSPLIQANIEKKSSYNSMLEKCARKYRSPAHFAKKMLVEDIAQNAVRSVPFFMVPVALSQAFNKNIKGYGEQVRKPKQKKIVIDVPSSKLKPFLSKSAAYKRFNPKSIKSAYKKYYKKNTNANDDFYKIKKWKDFAKNDIPESVARSVAWTLPITGLSLALKRNFRAGGEKIEKQQPLRPRDVRVTIETSPKKQDLFRSNVLSYMPKMASTNVKK